MNCIIPFTKDIKFKTNISEIVSISLEHEYTVNDTELLGNFLVTGEYKTHEVSINKEKFEFVLPFSVMLTAKVDRDTLDFNIEDFTYEVLQNNVLKVDIEYSVKASEIEEEASNVVFEREDGYDEKEVEELLEELGENVEQEEERKEEEKIEEINEVEEVEKVEKVEESQDVVLEAKEKIVEEQVKKEVEEVEEKRDVPEEEKETILHSVSSEKDEFVTYHIHILKDGENMELISSMYNVSISVLEEYNDLTNVSLGMKIIIPEENE